VTDPSFLAGEFLEYSFCKVPQVFVDLSFAKRGRELSINAPKRSFEVQDIF
jgi:hypothetical protein